jgi:hypothetical protein
MANSLEITAETVELDATDGVAFIEQASPLTRLHYFDGKFLRADALALEQDYHRHRVRLSNLAGGWGAVHGFGISRSGNRLDVGAGLAITAAGSFVLATADFSAQIDDLLKVAAPPPPAGSPAFADCLDGAKPAGVTETNGLAIYEITVGPVEGLCGNEPVYGKLCESACATDTRHPYWREGVVLRLRPVNLQLAVSAAVKPALAHLRNRIASAYFAAEPWLTDTLVSGAGLASHVWCEPAMLYGRDEVVIGLLAREGGVTRVLDAWSGRRERMDTQARGYWQGRMSMRPWNVFVAQILQFQCQLAGLFEGGKPVFEAEDDCDELRTLLEKTRKEVDGLLKRYSESAKKIKEREEGSRPTIKEFRALTADLSSSQADLDNIAGLLADTELGKGALPKQRMLLSAGFFELPPAGYLPVDPQIEIEEQVQRMFGEGVKLHFHAVRHDEIAHLVEEAQHMERISLTRGLDNPKDAEQVEIFVPDGEVSGAQAAASGTWWRLDMDPDAIELTELLEDIQREGGGNLGTRQAAPEATAFDGLVRTESRDDDTYGFTLVGAVDALAGRAKRWDATYVAGDIGRDPFTLKIGGETALKGEMRVAGPNARTGELQLSGTLTVLGQSTLPSGREERRVQVDLQLTITAAGQGEDNTTRSSNRRLALALQRDGDGTVGHFIIDDDKHDPSTTPIFFEWEDAPRRAAMFVQMATFTTNVVLRQLLGTQQNPPKTEAKPKAAGAGSSEDAKQSTANTRRQMVGLTALPAMPEPGSALQSLGMTTLVKISEATDDSGFLVRARKRLFPVLDAPKTQTVRAKRDWVMFRRARTHLCGPVCEAPPAQGLEAFQVWHIKLEKPEEIARLKAALDNHSQNVLAEYKFTRVGILQYRDEGSFSEESAAAVLDMWQPIKPGPQVGLGRVWETAPATGQGWQNHFRMRNMLKQIDTLTKTPPTGVLAAIPVPSDNLNDAAFDGGMLIVTTGQAGITRKALLIYTKYSNNQHFPGGSDTPRADMSFVDDLPKDDAHIAFTKNKIPNGAAINGVTLATVKTAPDAGAKKRVDAMVAAIVASGRPAPAGPRLKNGQLSTPDRDRLTPIGVAVDQYDEIIFFEVGD